MLFHLFDYIEKYYNIPGAGLFQFITFRAGMAILLSLIISIIWGNGIIARLKSHQIGETVRELGLQGQKEKEGTPTMGGIIILLAILIPTLLLCDLTNIYVILMVTATVWMALIGGIDDYIKVFKKNKKGLHGKFKIFGQVVLGLIIATSMLTHDDIVVRMTKSQAIAEGHTIILSYTLDGNDSSEEIAHVKATITNIPFIKNNTLDYRSLLFFLGENAGSFVWLIFVPLIIIVVTALSNAVNLTDGIDGLAAGTSAISGLVLVIFAYVSSNAIIADYLNILFLPNTQELVIFGACFLGACIGFLWYNSFPAKVFMGDTGSLALGSIIAVLAILLRKEMLLPIFGGIFLVETLSVMMQVSYFKYTRKKYGEGRRIFLMSPIHHHYQKIGVHEAKIVTRFWIIAILLAILAIITLKLR
ncbi:MAG: phospho-N-acetylmuramoyl-pentapeptide-transferase [Saprospiraceae bacterium]|nr:phospho-N-acetylmuramoyl-pentapeptide-transferase [Saprospiraceae bacterium]|tara:strand:- start:2376 stop:3626 length:1251 start_codon:yes stop_codon:yes gene_type:complete